MERFLEIIGNAVEFGFYIFLSWFIVECIRCNYKADKESKRKEKELLEKRKTDPDYGKDGVFE